MSQENFNVKLILLYCILIYNIYIILILNILLGGKYVFAHDIKFELL